MRFKYYFTCKKSMSRDFVKLNHVKLTGMLIQQNS